MGRKLLTAMTLLPLLLSCGGGSSPPPMLADFCTQLAAAECKVNCAGLTPEPCQTNRKAACMANAATATSDNTRFFTAANMADCINRSKSAYGSTAPITAKTLADIDRACNYVFQGKKVLLTDACTTQYECAGATNGTILCDKGFCAKASAAKGVGMPCGNPGDVCTTGNYCGMNASSVYVCTAKAATGASCASTPCLETLRCVGGTCVDRVASGMTCTSGDDCVAAAAYCDPYAGGICDQGLVFTAGSDSCTVFAGGGGVTGAGGTTGAAGTSGGAGAGGATGAAGTTGAAGGGGAGGGGNPDAASDASAG